MEEIKQRNELNFALELVIADRVFKEHDRGIFMNYHVIRSGGSFNYFNSAGKSITSTDITFSSMENVNERAQVKKTLKEVNDKIEVIKAKKSTTHVFGECKNRLLTNGL